MKKVNTALVVHREYWPNRHDLAFRKNISTGTGPSVCKDCAQVLDRQSPLKRCKCCKATVCARHSRQAEMHAETGQIVGGLMTLCTYCVRNLKVPGRTVLTESNTYANARSVPAVSSKPPPAPLVEHRKCHEGSWRECLSLLGFSKRNHHPLGQPSSTPSPHTAEAPDIRVKKCSHGRTVSWGEDLLHLFQSSDGEEAGGGQAWSRQADIRSSRRTDCRSFPLSKLNEGGGDDRDHARPTQQSSWLKSSNPFAVDDDGDDNGKPSPPTSTNPFSESTNPFAETVREDSGDPSRPSSTNPFSAAPACEEDSSSAPCGTGSIIFPVHAKQAGWDGWSTPPPESGPARSAEENTNNPAPKGEREGEGEGPSRTLKSGLFASRPKMAGALAAIGVAATVGAMLLRRRR